MIRQGFDTAGARKLFGFDMPQRIVIAPGALARLAPEDVDLFEEEIATADILVLQTSAALVDAGELHRDPDGRNYRRGEVG